MNKATFEFHDKEITLESPDAQMLQASIRRFSMPDYFSLIGKAVPKPVRRILDVGACIGAYSLLFHEIWPEAEIWALEPSSRSFGCLELNTKHIPNIHCIQLAAGEAEYRHGIAIPTKEQKEYMNFGAGNCGVISMFGESDIFREEVQVSKLDDIIGWCDFIKIDTEGYEYRVIQGAARLLKEARPTLHVEMMGSNFDMAGTSAQQVTELILSFNYLLTGVLYQQDSIFTPREKCVIYS